MNKSCLVCQKHLHNSNKKTQCSICSQFAHMCCINTDAVLLYKLSEKLSSFH